MIIVSIWLHGKPNWALPLENKESISPKLLKKYGYDLKNHFTKVSKVVSLLQNHGWRMFRSYGVIYTLEFYKDDMSDDQAISELSFMGINNIPLVSIEQSKLR